jgi:hypothetical protein
MFGFQIAAIKYWLFCLCVSVALIAEGLRTSSSRETCVGAILSCICIYDLLQYLRAKRKAPENKIPATCLPVPSAEA